VLKLAEAIMNEGRTESFQLGHMSSENMAAHAEHFRQETAHLDAAKGQRAKARTATGYTEFAHNSNAQSYFRGAHKHWGEQRLIRKQTTPAETLTGRSGNFKAARQAGTDGLN
jgi:hypothetical protein